MVDGKASIQDAFERVYTSNEWGKGSGPGSSPSNTIEYRAFVSRFIEANNVRRVTDLGCGDWQFSHLMDWTGIDYVGLDAVPEIVQRNRRQFGQPNVRFEVSSSPDDLPGGDLLVSKEVLQHLPNATILAYLNAIRCKYRFALLTNSVRPVGNANVDVEAGGFRPILLEHPPFNAPGAVVFTYFPLTDTMVWKNGVFLMLGQAETGVRFPVGAPAIISHIVTPTVITRCRARLFQRATAPLLEREARHPGDLFFASKKEIGSPGPPIRSGAHGR